MTEQELAAVIGGIVPVVRDHVTKLLGDVAQRVAAAEARLSVLGDLRDRVVAVETKAAMAPLPDPALGDLRDRVVALETTSAQPTEAVTALIERVAIVETKAAQPMPALPAFPDIPVVDLTPLCERLAAIEARLEPLEDLRDTVVTLETKAAMPLVSSAPHERLAALETRVEVVQERQATVDAALKALPPHSDTADLTKQVEGLRERLVAVEVRGAVPGPQGPIGAHGANGRDGVNGLGFDDFEEEMLDNGRVIVRRYTSGDRVKECRHQTATMIYRGVYIHGKQYERGDVVTWSGATWHANVVTVTKPDEGHKDWTLMVKRGRDGKDGLDAQGAVPVVRTR